MHMTAPDGTQYTAEQMHFHWGGASSEIKGSEHTIDGNQFVAEVLWGPQPGPLSSFQSHSHFPYENSQRDCMVTVQSP